jgi:uncharacterized protein (DUF4415 family)
MTERERDTKADWIDPDDSPEWTDEMFDRAQISVGGVVVREATGTLTKRGRPPLGDAPKQQVTLRLPRHVLDHFKAGGPGWQTRIGEVLERHAGRSSRVAEDGSPYRAEDQDEAHSRKR